MWATEIIKKGSYYYSNMNAADKAKSGKIFEVDYKDMKYSEAYNMHNYYMMKYVGDYKTYFVWKEPQ